MKTVMVFGRGLKTTLNENAQKIKNRENSRPPSQFEQLKAAGYNTIPVYRRHLAD